MAATPRLNSVIKVLEQGGVPIATFVSPPTVEGALAVSTTAVRRGDIRDGARPVRHPDAARLAPVHAEPPADRGSRHARAGRHAVGPDSAERRRDEPVDRQAGARHRRLRHRLAARQHGRGGVQRRGGVPLPAPEDDAPPTSREGQRGDAPAAAARYWGLSQQEYYAKADVWPLDPDGEVLVVIMCEEVKAIDNLPQHPGAGAGHRRRADRRGRPVAEPRLSAPVRAPAVVEAMAAIRADLQGARRRRAGTRTSTRRMPTGWSGRATPSS